MTRIIVYYLVLVLLFSCSEAKTANAVDVTDKSVKNAKKKLKKAEKRGEKTKQREKDSLRTEKGKRTGAVVAHGANELVNKVPNKFVGSGAKAALKGKEKEKKKNP